MHLLTNWFIRNSVAANLIMLLIMVAGAVSFSNLRIEGFPKVPADTVNITTVFAGAHSKQVDENITQKIEQAIVGTPGIKRMNSTSMEGLSNISVNMVSGHSLDRLINDIRIKVAGIYNLPQEAENPVISRNEFDLPALIVQLYGDIDHASLQFLGKQLRDALLAKAQISKLNIWGLRQQELSIELNPFIQQKYNLTLANIADKIQQSSLRFRAGNLTSEQGNHIVIRADQQAIFKADFAQIPILDLSDGSQLYLADIATIKDGLEEDNVVVKFNGQHAIGMEVLIGQQDNLLEIAEVVQQVVKDYQHKLPKGVYIDSWADTSDYISERLDLLKSNAFLGLIFVFILLALFLNVKLAFWVALGVPIAVMGTGAVMGLSVVDYSLNDITTFGFIIALGILVDDAVVVGESVYSERTQGINPIKETERGVAKVATATIYGVLTTIAAFYPMMLIDNAFGKVLASFAGVVICALAFSLFESKFLLPAHLAHTTISQKGTAAWYSRLWRPCQRFSQNLLEQFNQLIYQPILIWCLKQRYAVFILFSSIAIFGIGLISTGQIRTTFFPQIPGQVISIDLAMDARAPYQLTLDNAQIIESVAGKLNQRYQQQYNLVDAPIKHILVAATDSDQVQIYAELTKAAKRQTLTTQTIVEDWQSTVGVLEGAEHLVFTGSDDTGGGFALQVYANDVDKIKQVSEQLSQALASFAGVSSIRSTLKSGSPEISLTLKPEARHLGFTASALAQQVGYFYGGLEAQRIQRHNQEVKVMVRGAKEVRTSIDDLMQTKILSSHGQWLPLTAIADFHSSYSTNFIERRDSKMVNTIYANIDQNITSAGDVWQTLSATSVNKLSKQYPTVSIKGAGELEEMGEVKSGLIKALIITCLLIYALLAIPLKSYLQPFIIMSIIPLGFVGAAFGHLIADIPLSLLSFFGMLALAGVVVNDSLVMITRFNQLKADMPEKQAIIAASTSRLRPIFLTTVTTVAGLLPLLNESSEQAQYLIPAAVSLAYGEIFATLLMLILVPVVLQIVLDIKSRKTRSAPVKGGKLCQQ